MTCLSTGFSTFSTLGESGTLRVEEYLRKRMIMTKKKVSQGIEAKKEILTSTSGEGQSSPSGQDPPQALNLTLAVTVE